MKLLKKIYDTINSFELTFTGGFAIAISLLILCDAIRFVELIIEIIKGVING